MISQNIIDVLCIQDFLTGSTGDNFAIDAVFLDKTGPVIVVAFGELANELSRKANELIEKQTVVKGCLVSLTLTKCELCE